MWNPFIHNDNNHLIKFDTEKCKVFVTDLKILWVEQLTCDMIVHRFKEMNSVDDVNSDEVINVIVTLIKNIALAHSVTLSMNNDLLIFKIKAKENDVLLKFEFTFTQSTCDEFLLEFTIPLIQSIHYLKLVQNDLCNLLEQKDKEIAEYKMKGVEITRDYLITEKFDRNIVSEGSSTSLLLTTFDNREAFYDNFAKKYGSVSNSIPKLNQSKSNTIKMKKKRIYSSKNVIKKGAGITYKNQIKTEVTIKNSSQPLKNEKF